MNKKKINTIIVDDESGCIANLHHYLQRLCPEINIVATGDSLTEVLQATTQDKIDLAFLDVELYDDNIFTALSQAGDINFKIVFVTAYENYALKAIKTDALDYMLKPLSEDDIKVCYGKIKKYFFSAPDSEISLPDQDKKNRNIIIKNLDKVYVVKGDDICYMSGNGAYTEITFLQNKEFKSITVSKVLNKIEEEYRYDQFFRVHKSHIVNTDKIIEVISNDGMMIKMCNKVLIPVAKRRIQEFMVFLNTRR